MAKLLLLTDEEAAFLERALETWVLIHAGEGGPEMDRARVDRFHVNRKLLGKYTKEEIEDVGSAALRLLG